MSKRSEALAGRLEAGAAALAAFANTLSDAAWQTRLPKDGRKVGVVIHHVASVYPVEIHLAQLLAKGQPVPAHLGRRACDECRARQGPRRRRGSRRRSTLLASNSAAAAAAIRALSDAELDNAAAVGLNSEAPLTCQFMLEDHAVRHSYHHLARIKAALQGV